MQMNHGHNSRRGKTRLKWKQLVDKTVKTATPLPSYNNKYDLSLQLEQFQTIVGGKGLIKQSLSDIQYATSAQLEQLQKIAEGKGLIKVFQLFQSFNTS